jgi:hypothetical protein
VAATAQWPLSTPLCGGFDIEVLLVNYASFARVLIDSFIF